MLKGDGDVSFVSCLPCNMRHATCDMRQCVMVLLRFVRHREMCYDLEYGIVDSCYVCAEVWEGDGICCIVREWW
jgi:hypothetical protein